MIPCTRVIKIYEIGSGDCHTVAVLASGRRRRAQVVERKQVVRRSRVVELPTWQSFSPEQKSHVAILDNFDRRSRDKDHGVFIRHLIILSFAIAALLSSNLVLWAYSSTCRSSPSYQSMECLHGPTRTFPSRIHDSSTITQALKCLTIVIPRNSLPSVPRRTRVSFTSCANGITLCVAHGLFHSTDAMNPEATETAGYVNALVLPTNAFHAFERGTSTLEQKIEKLRVLSRTKPKVCLLTQQVDSVVD